MLRRLVLHVLGLLLVVAGLLAPPAVADEAVTLAGTNVVTGSVTSRVTVRVESDAVLDLTAAQTSTGDTVPRAFQAEGEGDFVGFVLTEPLSTDGFFAGAVRTPALGPDGRREFVGFGQPAVEDREASNPVPQEPPTCVRCVVPAGEYHLYLVSGFGDAKVTFTLEGLAGTAKLGTDRRPLFTNEGMGDDEQWFRGNGGALTGGGMSRGFWAGHESPEPGLLLHAYRTTATPASAVPMLTVVEHCESAGGPTTCEQDLDADGPHDTTGFVVTGGTMTERGVTTSVDLSVTGAESYTIGQTMLWLPLDHFIPSVGIVKADDARFDVATW